jgi:small RNA 2'-O-methyltransferase
LPNDIYSAFSAMLLGVYHPQFLLVTTPSYTFNARFTLPDAPKSARRGYPDPTGRTDRIFRHHDHKFEWTREEFTIWCEEAAKEWGYSVQQTSIGRAIEQDPWGRDEELQGATSVVVFRRLGDIDKGERERKGRAFIQSLGLDGTPHEALAIHKHLAHATSMKPTSLEDIAQKIKSKMEEYREGFKRIEELWFEQEIAVMCGGWIEMLVRAVEESPDLVLRNEVDGVRRGRSMWNVELIGGVRDPEFAEGDRSLDLIPQDWTPGEGPYDSFDEMSDISESTGMEGDVSACTSENEADDESDEETGWGGKREGKQKQKESSYWSEGARGWDEVGSGWAVPHMHSSKSSTAGWDGDEDESDNTTS